MKVTPKSPDSEIPIWLAALQQDVAHSLLFKIDINFDIWEVLLADRRVKAGSCFFLLQDDKRGSVTQVITLKQIVEQSRPTNMDRLLTFLGRNEENSYLSITKEFLSRFIPDLSKQASSLKAKTAANAPYRLQDKKAMILKGTICDDIQIGRCSFRIY